MQKPAPRRSADRSQCAPQHASQDCGQNRDAHPEVDRLRAELIDLDATLRLFDPETDPNDIPAVRQYPKRTEWFASGEVTRRLYEAYRNEGIIWPNAVARRAIAGDGIPETDSKVVQDIISIFAHVAACLTRCGKLVKIGKGKDARWKVAPDEPELL